MELERLIMDILRKQKGKTLSVRDIVDLSNYDNLEVCEALSRLELEGKILAGNDTYKVMPSDYRVGKMYTNSRGDKYVITTLGEKIFINCQFCGVKEYDTVVIEVSGSRQGEVKKIVSRDNEKALFEVIGDGDSKSYKPIGNSIKLNLLGGEQLVDGDIIYVSVGTNHEDGVFDGYLDSVVGHRDDPGIEIKQIALSHNIDINFSSEAIEELANIPSDTDGEDLSRRVDLRDHKIFTIDGADTKDIDDAISIDRLPNGNFLLGVHIADVSHYIKDDSQLFKDAYQRATSVYLANSVIPMIPHQLSNGICSLNPDVDRLALSCVMELDNKCNIVNYDIFKSIIRSKKKMTYDDVNAIIANEGVPEGYDDFFEEIMLAKYLSKMLTKRAINRGKLDFDSNEAKVFFDDDNHICTIKKREQKAAETIIENFMTCTNEVIAFEFGQKQHIPFVFRVHEEPKDRSVDKVIGNIEALGHKLKSLNIADVNKLYQVLLSQCALCKDYPVTSTYILRSMPKAKYSTENLGHFGLGSENYTHFTSPIRRLPDLLIHMVISKSLEHDLDPKSYRQIESFLNKAAYHASQKEREADRAEADVFKLMCINYINEHPDEIYDAYIIDVDDDGMDIKTDNLICGRINIDSLPMDTYYNGRSLKSKEFKLDLAVADKIKVKAKNTSKENLNIDFELQAIKEKAKQYKKSK